MLGAFAAAMLAGRAGLRPDLPFYLQGVELLLALAGAAWAGHRGLGVLAALGLTRAEARGVALAFFGCLPMAVGLDLTKLQAALSSAEALSALASSALVGALLAPVGEELLFRGYAVGRLREAGWSRARAFLAPGLLFGLLHVPGALEQGLVPAVMSGLITAAGGIWYGWLFLRWGRSVWVPLVAHAAMNTWWILGSVGPVAGSGGALPNAARGVAIALITILTLRWTTKHEPGAA